ncbi:Fatty acid transporter protein [Verticillium dahliae VDG2]|nr:Fatty acid transporter protein [Verticillium dahliae VDG2]
MPDYVQAVPNCLAWLFRESGPEWREIWDYQFKWTADHRTAEEMRPMIYTYDKLGEAALNRLDEISPPERTGEKGDTPPPDAEKKAPRDLYALVRDNADTDEVLGQLWKEVTTVPEWVDWAQIERGQHVFLRYAGPAIFALAFQSLVGGMGSRRVVETLARTGGFGVNVTRRRLLETFQHVLQVTSSLPAIQPHGDGFASTIRVRLLHAAVRRRILALAAQKPEYYSVEANGIPINDLDSAGTIATFSATLLWIGLPRQGIFLSAREKADYIALWRWVAHVIGAPTDPFATPTAARATMESLLLSELHPSATSATLANNLGALGAETAFEFQYVPVLDTMATEVGTLDEAMRRGRELGVGSHERRSLWTLSVAGVVVGCGSWAGWLCLRGGVRALMGLLR